jgi:hypothetical protein
VLTRIFLSRTKVFISSRLLQHVVDVGLIVRTPIIVRWPSYTDTGADHGSGRLLSIVVMLRFCSSSTIVSYMCARWCPAFPGPRKIFSSVDEAVPMRHHLNAFYCCFWMCSAADRRTKSYCAGYPMIVSMWICCRPSEEQRLPIHRPDAARYTPESA